MDKLFEDNIHLFRQIPSSIKSDILYRLRLDGIDNRTEIYKIAAELTSSNFMDEANDLLEICVRVDYIHNRDQIKKYLCYIHEHRRTN
jgi:hypothetical protein